MTQAEKNYEYDMYKDGEYKRLFKELNMALNRLSDLNAEIKKTRPGYSKLLENYMQAEKQLDEKREAFQDFLKFNRKFN